jgi:hypothetical protein
LLVEELLIFDAGRLLDLRFVGFVGHTVDTLMASFTGFGGIKLGACAYASFTPEYERAWTIGQKVFLKKLARNGHLEWVYVKRIEGTSDPIYVDTLNARHREGDLCTEVQALVLAILFYERYVESLRRQVGCHPNTSGP